MGQLIRGIAWASIFLASGFARATSINFISANRSVSVSDTAGASNGSTTAADSQSGSGFADFHGNVSKTAEWVDPTDSSFKNHASSSAVQDSTFGPNSFSVASAVSTDVFGSFIQGGNDPAIAMSSAESLFEITFSVSSATLYQFDFAVGFLNSGTNLDLTALLASDHSSVVVDLASASSTSGLLEPGQIYTLTFNTVASFNIPDPLGQQGGVGVSLLANFASVPDQGATVSLVLGLLAIAAMRLRFGGLRHAPAIAK